MTAPPETSTDPGPRQAALELRIPLHMRVALRRAYDRSPWPFGDDDVLRTQLASILAPHAAELVSEGPGGTPVVVAQGGAFYAYPGSLHDLFLDLVYGRAAGDPVRLPPTEVSPLELLQHPRRAVRAAALARLARTPGRPAGPEEAPDPRRRPI